LIAAAAGGLLSFVGNYFRTQETSLIALARGAVAGIVSVSAGLNDINPWAAVIIGAIGGIIYLVVTLTLKGTKIDDPAHAVSLHLVFIQIKSIIGSRSMGNIGHCLFQQNKRIILW